MRKEEFESRIRELLPDVSEKAMDHTASYAEELEREAEECAESLYDAFYVELALVKRDHGAEIAKAIFDCGEHFTFNFFELRGAAHLLAHGWSMEQVEAYTVEDSCTYAVSFNGKTRFTVDLSKSMGKDEVEAHVRGLEQTARYVAGGNIAKVIVVPGKIVNIVVK